MRLTKQPLGWLFATTGLAALTAAALVTCSQAAPPVKATPAKRTVAPLEEPLRLMGEARKAFASVQDYTCTMVKRERIDGQLQTDSIITMKARNQPFSVYLKWHEPKSLTGQEACYVAGKNNGKMRVKPNGFLSAVGYISLDPNDPRAQKSSKRNITEAGIGNLIERVSASWEVEQARGRPIVRIGEFEYNKRRCIRIETINSGLAGNDVPVGRSLIYIDKENHLPIRIECYDWPKDKSKPGELLEVYSFVNLKLNVGLDDAVFNH